MQPPKIKGARRFPASRASALIAICIVLPLMVLVGAHLSLLHSGPASDAPDAPDAPETALQASAKFLASTSKFFRGPPTPEPTTTLSPTDPPTPEPTVKSTTSSPVTTSSPTLPPSPEATQLSVSNNVVGMPPGDAGRLPPQPPQRFAPFNRTKHCQNILAPGNRQQVCCKADQNNLMSTDVICFPNVVIMGSQKTGTTALHSFLMLHPQVRYPSRKELHLFDIDRNYESFKQGHFASSGLTPSLKAEEAPLKVTVEATPSYTANHMACQRMRKHLSPDTSYIVILRHPTKRVWSELMMKRRRILSQHMFKQSLIDNFESIRDCSQPERMKNHGDFAKCVPASVSGNPKFSTFVQFVRRFDPRPPVRPNPQIRSGRRVSGNPQGERLQGPTVTAAELLTPIVPNEHGRRTLQSQQQQTADSTQSSPVIVVNRNNTVPTTQEPPPPPAHRPCFVDKAAFAKCVDPNGPMGRMFGERDVDHSIIFQEIIEVANKTCPYDACKPLFNQPWKEECMGCGCDCFPKPRMMSDISRFFVWRSMYRAHLEHCFQHIPRSKVLVIDHAELETKMPQVMDEVVRFTGLSYFNWTGVTDEMANGAFDRAYPGFKNNTGWGGEATVITDKTHIPEEMKESLDMFFHDDVDAVRKLSGLALPGWP